MFDPTIVAVLVLVSTVLGLWKLNKGSLRDILLWIGAVVTLGAYTLVFPNIISGLEVVSDVVGLFINVIVGFYTGGILRLAFEGFKSKIVK